MEQLFTMPRSSSLILGGKDGIVQHPLLTPVCSSSSGNPSVKNSQSYFRLKWFLGNQNYRHRNRLSTIERNMRMGAEGSMGKDWPRIH